MSVIEYEGDGVLRDGTKAYVRSIRPSDEERLLNFLRSLSDTSRWLRFFARIKDEILVTEAHRETSVDTVNTFGLVATTDRSKDAPIIGHAFYVRKDQGHAETAFTVADEFQGRGLGTMLLYRLACIAAKQGVRVFEADVLPVNQRMLEILYHSGFKVSSQISSGQMHIEFPIDLGNSHEEDLTRERLKEVQRGPQDDISADLAR